MGRPATRMASVPAVAGIGLRAPHYRAMLERRPPIGWLEVHSENYFGAGGLPWYCLERLRESYPVSLHGVGLSLGSTDPLAPWHLARLRRLIERIGPALVSEHLSWGSIDGRHLHDLLPLPYTGTTLRHLCDRIDQVQTYLGRRILIENVSSYLEYRESTLPEWEFVVAVAQRSGCGLLLDVNNVYVNARNHGFDPYGYVQAIPGELVEEVHLAGFTLNRFADGELLVDTHNQRVAGPVWALYRALIDRIGRRPTLIEWDSDLPELEVLLDEAGKADELLGYRRSRSA